MIYLKKYFFVALFAFVVSSCSDNTEISEKNNVVISPGSQVLKINIQGDPRALHPHLGVDLNCRSVQKALYEGLTRLAPEEVVELALAQKVDISEDHTVYTFTLRPSVWSNGEKVTAFHFEKAWKSALSPVSGCLRADLFYVIKNAKKAKKRLVSFDQVGIHALDDSTLVVELENPTPYFLDLLSLPIFAPLWDASNDPKVFNGPFIVASWEHEKCLTLERNPQYWDKEHVQLSKIVFSLVHDPNTAFLMYEKNELDWAGSPFTMLPSDVIAPLEQEHLIKSQPVAGVYWFCLNTQLFPLTSAKIRKSLSLAIDRDAISKHVLYGETPTYSLMPLNFRLIDPSEHCLDTDIALAKKYFEEGLKELDLTKEKFPTLQLSHNDVPGQKKLAEAVAVQWKKILGINIELSGAEWNSFFDSLGSRQYQIGGCIWFSTFNDPICTLSFFKDRTHRYNAPQWENSRYKELLELADNSTDVIVRKEYLREAELILLEEAPVIPVFISHHKYISHDYVKGIYIAPTGLVDFKWSSIDAKVDGKVAQLK